MAQDKLVAPSFSVLTTAKSAIGMAARGLPAIRAALHGARLGAGAAFTPAVVERLGVQVVQDLPNAAQEGVRAMMVLGKDGVALRMSAVGGVGAVVSQSAVRSVAMSTARAALAGVGRAVRQGAVAGAVVDGMFGVVEGVQAVRAGTLTRKGAAALVGKRAARGAVAGAGGVAAAGAASALVAAAGLALGGAPIVVPFVAMAATGIALSRGFDKLFGE